MRISIPFIFLLFFVPPLFAQKGQPAFGKVDKADLLMIDCDFDKGADALVLIDYGNTYYGRDAEGNSSFKTVFERRTRIKILKEKGISQANIEIPYHAYNNEEIILRLNANTYNIDESGKMITTEVKKSSVYTKRIDRNYSKMIIAFPEVKAGSIIEYAYAVESETYSLRNWYFQDRLPVRYSGYQLTIPKIFRFALQPFIIDSIEDTQEVIDELIRSDNGLIQTKSIKSNYIMRNLQGIKDELFMGAPKDYMQRLEFQMTRIYYSDNDMVDISLTWSDIINRLMEDEDFGLQLEKTIPTAGSFVEEAKQITDAETKIKFIYNHIRSTTSWNGKEENIYTDNGIVQTWDTKTGNAADINLLLVKLLKDAGVKTEPILFSTREHGLVARHYPSINQFNTVMALVNISGKTFVLDATDKTINYKMVPEKVVNTGGFIIDGEDGEWKDFPPGKYSYKIVSAVEGQVDTAGIMKGNGLVNCYDYARKQRCEEWAMDKEKFKEDHFIKAYPALEIEEILLNNLEADSLPLEQKIKFSSPLNSSGDYLYFSVNLFSGLENNPFIADKRVADIDFGVPQEYIIFGNFIIPPGYVFDGLPGNFSMVTSDNGIVFTRTVQVESNLLNVRITVEFKKSLYPASSYPGFKEFYKKLFDKLNEQVVIRKKSTP